MANKVYDTFQILGTVDRSWQQAIAAILEARRTMRLAREWIGEPIRGARVHVGHSVCDYTNAISGEISLR